MNGQEARRHHFVPQFLLRPWTTKGNLKGYWWDTEQGKLRCKSKGTKAFCNQLDLLTLRAHGLGRDALEKVFFGGIDTKGADARDQLLDFGPSSLTADERCDFARLLLSLEARRSLTVAKLREGSRGIAERLDNDPEVLKAMAAAGVNERPSTYYERGTGLAIEDKILGTIQRLVDNPEIGGRLINASWHVVRLSPIDGSLVLSDRPLIRVKGYDDPGALWALPLAPNAAFVAANHSENLERIKRASPLRFVKKTNVSSVCQTERFVFCADASHEHWIGKHLSGQTNRN